MLARRFLCNVNDTRNLYGLCLLVTSHLGQIQYPWHGQAITIAHTVICPSQHIHSIIHLRCHNGSYMDGFPLKNIWIMTILNFHILSLSHYFFRFGTSSLALLILGFLIGWWLVSRWVPLLWSLWVPLLGSL